MQTIRNVLLTSICLVLLGACGLKGPLYLPQEEPVTEPTAELEAEPAADESEEKEGSKKGKKTDDNNGR